MRTNKGDRQMNRIDERAKLTPGQKVTMGEYPCTIVRLYIDGTCEGCRMYEVRLPGGLACVAGSDLVPVTQ